MWIGSSSKPLGNAEEGACVSGAEMKGMTYLSPSCGSLGTLLHGERKKERVTLFMETLKTTEGFGGHQLQDVGSPQSGPNIVSSVPTAKEDHGAPKGTGKQQGERRAAVRAWAAASEPPGADVGRSLIQPTGPVNSRAGPIWRRSWALQLG